MPTDALAWRASQATTANQVRFKTPRAVVVGMLLPWGKLLSALRKRHGRCHLNVKQKLYHFPSC